MIAEAIPSVWLRGLGAREQFPEENIDRVAHAHTTGRGVNLCRPAKQFFVDEKTFTVGQLAGPGTYQCENCGAETTEYALSFEIEPCRCGGTLFHRVD